MKLKVPKYITTDNGPDGKERFYFRRRGQKKIRIHGVPWTPSFMREYEAAMGGEGYKAPPAPERSGTFTWLCNQYFASSDFRTLDDETSKPKRRRALLKICREPITPGSVVLFGNVMLSNWNKKAIRAVRDRFADVPGTSRDLLSSLRVIFKYAVDADHVETNPTRDVTAIRSNNVDGHHSWTIEEVEKFEVAHAVGTPERLAMGIMLYVAQRLSDVIRLGRSHLKMVPTVLPSGETVDTPWLAFTQKKNGKRKPVYLEIPVRPELWELIEATPLGPKTFLINGHGEPHSERGFSRWFMKACIAAGVPGRSHGLRKAASARLAELGASEKLIQSITGHTTSQEITRYTKAARQKVLAAEATALSAKGKVA